MSLQSGPSLRVQLISHSSQGNIQPERWASNQPRISRGIQSLKSSVEEISRWDVAAEIIPVHFGSSTREQRKDKNVLVDCCEAHDST